MSNYNPFETIDARLANIENLLSAISQPQRPPELPDRCQLRDACEITGLSKAAIYKMTHEKTLPFMKFGSRLVFSRRQLTTWLDEHTLSPSSPEDELKANLVRSAKKHLRK
ncbi:MAG: helix-turn-helix domain-containing protein [Bacteroidota bacterium]